MSSFLRFLFVFWTLAVASVSAEVSVGEAGTRGGEQTGAAWVRPTSGDFRESLAALQQGADGWAEREYRARIVGILRQGQFAGAVSSPLTPTATVPPLESADGRPWAGLLGVALVVALGLLWRRQRVLAQIPAGRG